jgi:outer membrane lipoprotein-sorting protein
MRLTRRDVTKLASALALDLLAPASARGDAPDAEACSPERLDRALADVARARANVTTLTGPFTQERTIGLLAAKVRSTGTLTLVRPDRLRWDLAPPDDVVYWVTPEGLAYRSPTGQGKVPSASQKIAAGLDDLRILLGGDLAALRTRYDLSGTCHGPDRVTFRATPKAGTPSSFQELRFTLAPDLVSPETATIVEGPRDRTEIRFGTIRANVAVAPGVMTPNGP